MGHIKINNIEIYAHHGVLPSEKEEGQLFFIDCEFKQDSFPTSDALDETIHYGEVTETIISFTQNNRFDLIETLADKLTTHLLLTYSLMHSIELTIHKPFAPIDATFSDVSVTLTKTWTTSYLGIGSNLGDRKNNLNIVGNEIHSSDFIRELATSSYLETEPYGVLDQPNFLNAVIKISTFLSPYELLNFCYNLEKKAGRVKTRHWGERTLDVDILLYGNDIISTEALIVPHPEMHRRHFVLTPMCEIAPYTLHPIKQSSMIELKESLNARSRML